MARRSGRTHRDQAAPPIEVPPAQPPWLPKHIPELDGLRGLAVLGVFLHHCQPRLAGTILEVPARWGWAGVNLFFVLSGYLITAILLRARACPDGYFRNFYARRALRIWPLYGLLLAVCWLGPPGLREPLPPQVSHAAIFTAMCFMVQNLLHAPLGAALQPTWSLAVEEQFYWLWPLVVRFIGAPWRMAVGLAAVLLASPLIRWTIIRGTLRHQLNPQHTLLHLDAIAAGSLLAIGILGTKVTRRRWLLIGSSIVAVSVLSLLLADRADALRADAFMDSWIAFGSVGAVLLALAGSGARNPVAWTLRRGPLPWLGRISYGFYLTQIPVIILIGALDLFIDRSYAGGSTAANLLMVAVRLVLCILVATALWYGFERPLLHLKRFFPQG